MKLIKVIFILCTTSVLVTACGGGSTNSGQPSNTEQQLYSVGDYSGSITLTISNDDYASDPTETSATFNVFGTQTGLQQISVTFTQFSGSSSIDSMGRFSIPSGTIPLRLLDPTRQDTFAVCEGELNFAGTIMTTNIEGSIEGQFSCPFSQSFLIAEGTFSAQFGRAKQGIGLPNLDLMFELK